MPKTHRAFATECALLQRAENGVDARQTSTVERAYLVVRDRKRAQSNKADALLYALVI